VTRRSRAAALALCALALAPGAAVGAEPRLTVERSRMADALMCYGPIGKATPAPILFAPGTGSDGSQVLLLGGGAFTAMGRTLCAVSFPRGTTADPTVPSATDESVRPQTGPAPTSALRGAANLLIQDICPGRRTSHLGTTVDSVTIAALADAVAHDGPARAARLPRDVCLHPYGTGLDEARTSRFLALAPQLFSQGSGDLPVVRREPKVRAWAKRKGP
jgi:hypothetical protein